MATQAAIVGVGFTDATSPGRQRHSRIELSQEAAWNALRHARMRPDELDAVVVGNIDNFEGTALGARHLTRLLGIGASLPLTVVNTGGTTGGNLVHTATTMIRSGDHERVLCLGPATFDGAQDIQSVINTNSPMIVEQPLGMGAVQMGAFFPSAYQERFCKQKSDWDNLPVAEHANAALNPRAHLRYQLSADDVASSTMLSTPLTMSMVCPVSSGSCALVLASRRAAVTMPNPPVFVRTIASSSDPYLGGGRHDFAVFENLAILARHVYRLANIRDPIADIDVVEVFAPYSPMLPMELEALGFCEFGAGLDLINRGATRLGGAIPTNLSGGPKCTNAGVSGELAPFAYVALQLMGQAESQQVQGARRGLAHCTGGTFFQFNNLAILERDTA